MEILYAIYWAKNGMFGAALTEQSIFSAHLMQGALNMLSTVMDFFLAQ